MFTTKGQNLTLIILVVIAALTMLASLFFLRSETRTALAQEGTGDSNNQTSNYEAMQEAIRDLDLSDIIVTPLDAPAVGESGESVIGPQSDGSGVEVVPIAAFRHDGDNANGWGHIFAGGYILNTGSDYVCLMAPAYPPHGATLTAFSASLKDDSASSDLFVTLWRVNHATGAVDVMAGVGQTGRDSPTAVELTDPTIAPGTQIINNGYGYYVTLCFGPNTGPEILLYGARLSYTP